jgi:branched-chain amino acid transport system permease protein
VELCPIEEVQMIDFLNYLAGGTLVGLLYALVALGFVVMYRASKIFNFAQGELIALSGFLIWSAAHYFGLPPWAAIGVGILGASFVGFLIERIFFDRLVGKSAFSLVMVSLALIVIIRSIILLVWGPNVVAFPAIVPNRPFVYGEILVSRSLVASGFVSVVSICAVAWFFSRTRAGLALTAVCEDHRIAASLGISVRRSMLVAWAIGSGLSALAVGLFLSGKSLNYQVSDIGFAALPVALLSGLESIYGLLLAGVLVGVAQAMAQLFLNPLFGTDVAAIIPYLLILAILVARPSGLFGWQQIERV